MDRLDLDDTADPAGDADPAADGSDEPEPAGRPASHGPAWDGSALDSTALGSTGVTGPVPAEPERVADLVARLDGLEHDAATVRAEVLPALDADLAAGRAPQAEQVGALVAVTESMTALFRAVGAAAGGAVPDTLGRARCLLDEITAANSVRELLRRVRTLTGLVAPDYAATEAAEVAALAASADETTGPGVLAALDALVSAIELGDRDPRRGLELTRLVQAELPTATPLVTLALLGQLPVTEPAEDIPDTADPENAADTENGVDAGDAGDTGPTESTVDVSATEPAVLTEALTEVLTEAPAALDRPGAEPAPAPGESEVDELDAALAGLTFTIPSARPAPDSTAAPARPAPGPVATEGGDSGVTAGTDEPVADPHSPTDPHTSADPHSRAELLCAGLLRDRQFALAAWLSTALDQPRAVTAGYRLAAHALAMRTSAGPNAVAFADTATQLDAGQLDDDLGLQMLTYAASVRAGLLSPITHAAGPLRDIATSIVKSGPAVDQLTEALLAAIYSGAYLTPRSADAVAEAAEAEATHDGPAAEARAELQAGPSRTIRYALATELWQSWIAPTGHLGAPLSIVASGSRSDADVATVRARVAELRSPQSLDKAIDRDTRQIAGTRRIRRIEARARDKFLDLTGRVTDLLARWIEVTDDLNRPAAGTWMADPMAELRNQVKAVRASAFAELRALTGSGSPARDAAVEAGLALLADSLDLLDGTATFDKTELPADRVVNGPLALAADLPLDPALTPLRPVTVADIDRAATALRAGDTGWTEAFEHRARTHDQVGTQILIEMLRPTRPQLARRLTAERDRAVQASADKIDGIVDTLTSAIDSDRRFGRLTFDQWADLSSRAGAFAARARGARRDFDTMLAALAAIETERAACVEAAIARARAELAEADVPASARERILGCIDSGDITTANEYRETIRGGRDLPGPRDEIDHLSRFHPTFPELFGAATRGGRDPLVELRLAIEAGRTPDSGGLADALAAAGLDLGQIARAKTAAGRIDQWAALADERSLVGKHTYVKAVLEQLGFFAEKVTVPPSAAHRGQSRGRSSWLHLAGVRATAGKALIPAFGSRMSPSGDTLRLLAVWRSPTPQELVELLRSEPADHSIVVLYFGTLDPAARRELANQFHRGRRLPVTAVVDDAAFAYLAAQPEPGRDITMSITLPFTSAVPFTPDVAGLVAQEMFYGRTEERDKVVDMMGPCIVYGGRQLGKSALLRAAAREFDDGNARHAVYLSIFNVGQSHPVDTVWNSLWPSLAEKRIVPQDRPSGDVVAALTRSVGRWIAARPGRQLLLLLDESDSFLDADAEDGRFKHVSHFRELMESTGRAVKVVFAGLHQTARFERLANHPLAHFGDPICVGPLAPQPAYDLLTQPLRALGYRFESSDQAARVLALANNQPALIQLFGAQLLHNLHRVPLPVTAPPQVVTGADIAAVWSDDGLRNSFRKRFEWTLNLDPRYKVIAYSVAFHAHSEGVGATLTPTQLRSECEQWWPRGFAAEDVRAGEFHALLDECVDLGVLSYADGGYRLRTPNVLDLLGSKDEVDEVLDQAESLQLPESFDGSLMRPPFGDGVTRGPLTSQQIADLLAPRSQVRLIAGSAALTVERCLKVLRYENDKASHGRRGHLRPASAIGQLRHTCEQATVRAAGGHAVVVVDAKHASRQAALDAWRQARELIAAHSGGTLGIVLITTAEQAPLWPIASAQSDASSSVIGLRRYDNTDLRLWLNETTLPFQDDASRGELLAVTGGWPVNVNRVAEELAGEHESPGHDPLASIRAQLADPGYADALVTASGVRADAALTQAWTILCGEFAGERADATTLAEYLQLHADGGAAALTGPRLAELGYRDTGDVVDVLQTLGLLVTAEDGQLRVEPVMAAATTTAGTTTAGAPGGTGPR